MNKFKILDIEFEPGSDPRAKDLDKWVKERQGDASVLESATGQAARAEREAMFNGAFGMKKEEGQPEKKTGGEKKPFEDLRKELKELEESLTREGIVYNPLVEFRQKLEDWTVSLKESDSDDLDEEFAGVKKSSLEIASEIRNFKKKKQ
ncbi:MAG: hypothetical protein KKH04_05935 [Proteobacteria bacterium]|nr:hypothetical protein [Pseudomonadota bacterium]